MSILSNRIVVSMILSQDLTLRHNASVLFNRIETSPENHITVDFRNVRTMTRSFAQEYLSRKAKSRKTVKEIHASQNIISMFRGVETVFRKTELIDLKNLVMLDME